ncbi:aromatic amino acid DMT transporter YddG [Bifidobacterium callimiconis]|uniref:Uncharacterized protein n=1 Tax=Bifidobacterium callimiconis TaxID=2306973 RepID=A0A430FC84_9BIFI|nr:aromatic amino acid DMT transporter YddG [Bifidobacterium callimiconis]RSX50456.1 hypothetical protein D2E23_1479 [Bifidobacterium callimiconis]
MKKTDASAAATAIGMMAILLWSLMMGLVRLVSEAFGATLGPPLIYTCGAILLLIFHRPAPLKQAPLKYLLVGGGLVVFYESAISLSIGLAASSAQSVEISLVNYLWPTLMVLLAAAVSHRKHAVGYAVPGAIVATAGVIISVGGNSGLDWHAAAHNIASNPLPYALALAGAVAWAVYAVVTPSMANGYDGTSVFFPFVALALWIIHFVTDTGMTGGGSASTGGGAGDAGIRGIGAVMGNLIGQLTAASWIDWLIVVLTAASIAGGYACWGYGILHGSMETMAVASYATPLLSVAASAVLLHVSLSVPFWVGALLVVAGSIVNWLFQKR